MENTIDNIDNISSIYASHSASKKELLELILKFLYENNFTSSAKLLEERAAISYHQSECQQLKSLLLSQKYDEAIAYLKDNPAFTNNTKTQQTKDAITLIKIRKYIEMLHNKLLSQGNNATLNNFEALNYLRNNLANEIPSEQMNKFSGLLFIKDKHTFDEYIKTSFGDIVNDDIFINKIQNTVSIYINGDNNEYLQNTQIESLINLYDLEQQIENNTPIVYKQCVLIEKMNNSNNEDSKDEIWYIKFSKSCKYFVTALRNGTISTFQIVQQQQQQQPSQINVTCLSSFQAHKKYLTFISWSSNEKLLLSTSTDRSIKVWNPFNGTLLHVFNVHSDIVTCALFISDDKIASCGIDKKLMLTTISLNKTVEVAQFNRIRQILHSECLKCLIILPASLNDIIVYNYQTDSIEKTIEMFDPIITADISKHDKGKFIIVNVSKVNASILLINIENKEVINRFYGHRQREYVIQCAFGGKNDEFILAGSEDAKVYIWRRELCRPMAVIEGHTDVVNECHLIEMNGINVVVSGSDDHTLRMWVKKEEEVDVKWVNEVKKKRFDNDDMMVIDDGNGEVQNAGDNGDVNEESSESEEEEEGGARAREHSGSEENEDDSNVEE